MPENCQGDPDFREERFCYQRVAARRYEGSGGVQGFQDAESCVPIPRNGPEIALKLTYKRLEFRDS
jgi:hypothetical protein